MLFADGEDGVTDRNPQELNKEDCTCPLNAWKFDTEEFSKYFYSKYKPESNISSQMCTAYRRIGTTQPIPMKEGDVFKVYTGYKIYERTFAMTPLQAADGEMFMMAVGEGARALLTTLSAIAVTAFLYVF